MKIVKLNQRYVLGRYGFTHALRFPKETDQSDAIRRYLYKNVGDPWSRWGGRWNVTADWGYHRSPRRDRRTYWIGVKGEALLTAAVLAAETNNV